MYSMLRLCCCERVITPAVRTAGEQEQTIPGLFSNHTYSAGSCAGPRYTSAFNKRQCGSYSLITADTSTHSAVKQAELVRDGPEANDSGYRIRHLRITTMFEDSLQYNPVRYSPVPSNYIYPQYFYQAYEFCTLPNSTTIKTTLTS